MQRAPSSQELPQRPQCSSPVRAMQPAPQSSCPGGQVMAATHVPDAQVSEAAQAFPQAPQCAGLLSRSTQEPLQLVRLGEQLPPPSVGGRPVSMTIPLSTGGGGFPLSAQPTPRKSNATNPRQPKLLIFNHSSGRFAT